MLFPFFDVLQNLGFVPDERLCPSNELCLHLILPLSIPVEHTKHSRYLLVNQVRQVELLLFILLVLDLVVLIRLKEVGFR